MGSFAASRFTALIVVERRLVALLFLMVVVFRLTTPLLRQRLMLYPRPLAGLRLSGGSGYPDAPPAFFPSSSIPSWARPFGCSWALSPRRRSFGCGGKLLYRHGTVRQSRAASLLRVFDAHRGRAAPGRLTLPDGHGLSTHDADASAVVDAPSPSFGGAASFWWLWLPRCASGVFPILE